MLTTTRGIYINLFRSSVMRERELLFLRKLRLISFIFLTIIISFGILTGIFYFLGKIEYDGLEENRSYLSMSIGNQAKKQTLLISLQERLPMIQRILDSRNSFENVISTIQDIVSEQNIKTISMIEQTKIVTMTIQANSLEEIQSITSRILQKIEDGKIRSPIINSLVMKQDGIFEVVFSFQIF
ncbi:MAG: hypothetical protein N3A54_03125 [Patescibacteria group bacterium]|nr:hypothetical protein [Patescibacteria group bacterium]